MINFADFSFEVMIAKHMFSIIAAQKQKMNLVNLIIDPRTKNTRKC